MHSDGILLTEKFLLSMGGWKVFKAAKAMRDSGRVGEVSYEPPVLKARIESGGKTFLCGLKFHTAIDVDNLCPCNDSRLRGVICAHSIAAGLQWIAPKNPPSPAVTPTPAADAAPFPPRTTGRENMEETAETPRVELRLEGSLRHLEADIAFHYTRSGLRNTPAETRALSRLLAAGFEDHRGKAALKGEDAILRFFAGLLPKLQTEWNVVIGERFGRVTEDIVRIEPKFAIRELDDGWLSFRVHYAAGKDALLSGADIDALLRGGTNHTRLKNGKTAVANADLAADLEEVLRDCDPEQDRGSYRIPPACRGYLEASVTAWKHSAAPTGDPANARATAHKAAVKDLGSLAPRLRPYQTDGAVWMLERARGGLGGLLADEMGLGKTVQSLAMLEALGGTSLVVCPSSLTWNWQKEAATFLPEFRVLCLHGGDRKQRFAEIPDHDLILTSYALLRRDIERYRNIAFSCVLLDEAQHIKNPGSQNARAAGTLQSRSRFVLTGTPVENSIRDLWSLFDFLLPGYLGTQNDFQSRYEKPLLEGDRSPTWNRLLRRISPYLLRRRKQDVITDIPDKLEQIIELELTNQQSKAYESLREQAQRRIEALSDAGASGQGRMQVLTALLRLRQTCCDVRLLGARGEDAQCSAKLEALMELLAEAIDGGHRTLVFSQFTSMLDLIENRLEADGIAWSRLDGTTRDRAAAVEAFQTRDDIPVFLISLKAGGVGLNLTAADTVVHFDPWWNPAVEAQATDRAHRIGQKRVVTSIKLVARGTVEEKILRLQERKRNLLSDTLDADGALQRLDMQDLRELVG